MPLETIASLKVDLLDPGAPQVIHAVQDDSNSRSVSFSLYAGSTQWVVPDGTLVMVRVRKPDGKACAYDTLPDDKTPAATISGNVVTAALVPQAFTAPGNALVQIKLYDSSETSIATFAVVLHIARNVVSDAEIVSTDYYSILTRQVAEVLEAVGTVATDTAAAKEAAEKAAASATQAAGSATAAAGSASTASTAATNAQSSATAAAGSATTASNAASNASADAAAAENAKTAAETAATDAQGSAKSAAESASQAEATLANALPKTGGTISGSLLVQGGYKPVELGSFSDMESAGWEAIKSWYNAMPNVSSGYARISSGQAAHGLSTGDIHLEAYKTSTSYGTLVSHHDYPPLMRLAFIAESEWRDFTPVATTSVYTPAEVQSSVAVSRMMLAQMPDLTDDDKLRVSGLYDTWASGSYAEGDICNAEDQTWECIQSHDCAVYPDIAPGSDAWYTFWRPLHGKSPETARPFVPVQGAHDMYRAGEYAVFEAALYKCVQDTAYSPADYPQAWEAAT